MEAIERQGGPFVSPDSTWYLLETEEALLLLFDQLNRRVITAEVYNSMAGRALTADELVVALNPDGVRYVSEVLELNKT